MRTTSYGRCDCFNYFIISLSTKYIPSQAKERIEATGAATEVLKAEARKLMAAVEDEEAETDLKEGGLRDAQV